jgi:4-hydroxy-3-polyprenylbenzoate decarboxylase
LDHSSKEQFVGGKLGVDATGEEVEEGVEALLSDDALLKKIQKIESNVAGLKQYMTHTKNPVCVIAVEKEKSQLKLIKKLKELKAHIKLLVIVDKANNDLNDPYMLIWRVVNNIDAQRDVKLKPFIAIDATNKSDVDGFEREWPGDTFCTKEVLDSLQQKGLIDIDEAFIKKFGLLPF